MPTVLRPRGAPPEGGAGEPPGHFKNAWIALMLNVMATGLGELYCGRIGQGLLFLMIHVTNFALMYWFIGIITGPIFWLYGLFHAIDTAERINARQRKAMIDARYGEGTSRLDQDRGDP